MKHVTAGIAPTHFDNYMVLRDDVAAPIDVHPTTTLLLHPSRIPAPTILEMIKRCNKRDEAGQGFLDVQRSGCMDEYNLGLLKRYAGKRYAGNIDFVR